MAIGEIPVAVLFSAHAVIHNLSGERRVLTDKSHQNTTCPVKGGFSRTSDIKIHLSGGRRVFTDECDESATCPVEGWFSRTFLKKLPTLHAGDDLHYEKKQGRAAVGKGDEKVRADAYGEQD